MRNAECRVRNAECRVKKVRNAECGIKKQKKDLTRRLSPFSSIRLTQYPKTANVLAENHKYKIQQPYDRETENQTENARYDLLVSKSRHKAEYPRCYGYDCQNNAYNIRQSKIIA